MRDIDIIQKLVGHSITEEQLRYVDCAVHPKVGIFMPMGGQCFYAISPEHTHPGYSFILAFDSNCRTRIGDTVIESVPSTMAMIPPDLPHQEIPSEVVSRYIAIMIDASFFEEQLKMYGVSEKPNPETLHPICDRLVATCKEFIIDYQEALPGYKQFLESAAVKICHLIIRRIYNIESREHPITASMDINRAVEYIYSCYSDRIAVEELAQKAGLSPSHFSRVFKKELNQSPAEYILNTRLDFAKRMLRGGDKTLTDIALDCGFGSSSYFSQCFSKAFSISPSAFRKQHQTQH